MTNPKSEYFNEDVCGECGETRAVHDTGARFHLFIPRSTEQSPQVVDKRRLNQGGSTAKDTGEFFMEALDLVGGKYSPSSDPNKPIGMDFSTAIQQVVEGKRVTRLEWGNPEEYLLMFMWGQMNPKTPAGKYLTIHHADGAMHPLYISDGDLAGDDWVVVV